MRHELKEELDKIISLSSMRDDWECYEDCKKIIRKFERRINSPVDIYIDAVTYVADRLKI